MKRRTRSCTAAAAGLLLAWAICAPCAAAAAEDVVYETADAVYHVQYSDTKVSILSCETTASTVCMPTEIGGLPVWFSSSPFADAQTVAEITVEDNDYGYYTVDGVLFQDTTLISYPCAMTDETYAVPEGTTFLFGGSIANNPYLRRLDIPASVTRCYTNLPDCPKLSTINVDAENPTFSAANGLFMDKAQTTVHRRAPMSLLNSCILPETVETIDVSAFADNTRLTAVTFPESLRTIAYSAFRGCTALTKITVPEGTQAIRTGAFQDCTALETVQLPESLTELELSAFQGCTALTSINIPSGITRIPIQTFYQCTSLREITLPESVAKIEGNAFGETAALEKITILNPYCEIVGMGGTNTVQAIYSGYEQMDYYWQLYYAATICGYEGSTAQMYAEKWNMAFESLGAMPYIRGDVDEDGAVNASDAALVLIYAAESGSGTAAEKPEMWRNAADYNADGEIDASDAAEILIFAAQAGAGEA